MAESGVTHLASNTPWLSLCQGRNAPSGSSKAMVSARGFPKDNPMHKKTKQQNNWACGRSLPVPKTLCQYEVLCGTLGLDPSNTKQCAASPKMQEWCRKHLELRYIPTALLRLLKMESTWENESTRRERGFACSVDIRAILDPLCDSEADVPEYAEPSPQTSVPQPEPLCQ